MSLIAAIDWSDLLSTNSLKALIRAGLLLFVGMPLLFILSGVVGRGVRNKLSPQGSMLIRKGIVYIGSLALILSALYQMGFQLTALLGAAGIAGIAIGFASQTSISNIISGLFMISEKPFSVGDVIQVGNTTGIVLSIDLLAVKLRTFDNKFVRIPNETLIKSEVTNITRYPIRRLDIKLSVAYKEDVEKVRQILKEIASGNPHSLDEPEPLILFTNFGESGLEFLFGVWFAKMDFLTLRNSIMQEIKRRFDAEGIEIPFAHRTLYAGKASDPFPVRVVGQDTADPAGSQQNAQ
ncbi:MAG: mechanosensitive ion channel family protein [Phycisphaerae bacterium]